MIFLSTESCCRLCSLPSARGASTATTPSAVASTLNGSSKKGWRSFHAPHPKYDVSARRGAFVQEGGRKCPEDGLNALGFDDAVVDDDYEDETCDDCSGAQAERRITPLAEMNERLKLEVDRAIRENQERNAR